MSGEAIIDNLLEREGGFVNDPNDRGGATKYGITRETLSDHRGEAVSVDDVRRLTEDEARAIYREEYIEAPGYHGIHDASLQGLVVDAGVNHGTHRASRWLQRAAGASVDGVVGPNTLAAVNQGNTLRLYLEFLRIRVELYGRLITEDPDQARFAHGWMRRLGEFLHVPQEV
jgi:lysozyme family protein